MHISAIAYAIVYIYDVQYSKGLPCINLFLIILDWSTGVSVGLIIEQLKIVKV